jgi:hypothetical protein
MFLKRLSSARAEKMERFELIQKEGCEQMVRYTVHRKD